MPKVGILQRQEEAAPRTGDGAVRSRLYAGKTGESSTTRRSSCANGSDNVRGAEDQQERLGQRSENPQRPYADRLVVIPRRDDEMVRTLRRRREAGGDARPAYRHVVSLGHQATG